MKHQQILDKLASKQLNQSIDEDLANQVHLIKSGVDSDMMPDNRHLEEFVGIHTVRNLFSKQ